MGKACWAIGPRKKGGRRETPGLSVLGHAEREKKKAGPAEVLGQKHSKALLNFKSFIVFKYI
jgi:hypothetical protein